MRIVVINIMVAVVAYYWYKHVGRDVFIANGPWGLAMLGVGVVAGIWCNQPKKVRRTVTTTSRPAEAAEFDRITR